MSLADAGHGTLVAWEGSPVGTPGTFITIGELGGDITPPPLSRTPTEVTPHNNDIDFYIMGVMRREPLTFTINLRQSGEMTHNLVSGLIKGVVDKVYTGWRITFPDATEWIFSGFVMNVAPVAPVREGALTADVSVRPSGPHEIDSTIFGS